ncbi:DUF1993 domain-containing protein [Qipengyuania aurantiaca]|uniref:DUF1993 domain-containing protein n=1 Tax=Qipengyuania aurantiaca TaxID=2867233 RepID=A0ABX8ZP41_9SPHN|nr:DUF1993 family protein [Qipengyuania aurantiaca]QZD90788.1 DUF1993 domain-containing protein [Qipengyuania aurantiaca]
MSYAESAFATFDNMLGSLLNVVGKAMKADMGDAVLETKLAEDMFPLETQFRVAINQLNIALERVFGMKQVLDEEAYASLEEVASKLQEMKGKLATVRESGTTGPDGEIDFTLPNGMRFVMSAEEYIRDWTMPNFYFHTTMAYALLRHNGLAIGKADFVPHMVRYARPA